MKKLLFLALALLITSYTASAGEYIESQQYRKNNNIKTQTIMCNKEIKVASFATNPPFGWTEVSYRDMVDQPFYTAHGYAVDLMKKIGEELNVSIVPVGFDSDEKAWKAFQEGYVDILIGQYYDPKIRGLHHTYLAPAFFPNVISVVFRKGKEKEVKKFDDLIGLKGVVRIDEAFYPYIRKLLPEGLTIEEVPNSREAFTQLMTDKADYVMASPYSAEAEARRFKINEQIKMIPTPLLGQELFVLYSRSNPCPALKGAIEGKLRERRADIAQVKRDLISYIDKWGLRFIAKPSLFDELKSQGIIIEPVKTSEQQMENPIQMPTPQTVETITQSTEDKK